MSFGMNFTRVSLGKDDNGGEVLFVEGASEEPDVVKAIYVALAHGSALMTLAGAGTGVDADPHELPSVGVATAAGADTWNTSFPQASPPFVQGEMVIAVGAGVPRTDDGPFFWHQTLVVVSEDAVSERIVGTGPE